MSASIDCCVSNNLIIVNFELRYKASINLKNSLQVQTAHRVLGITQVPYSQYNTCSYSGIMTMNRW